MKGPSLNHGVNTLADSDKSTAPKNGRKSSAEKMRNLRTQVVNQLKTIDSKRGMDAVLEAPKRMKREWQKSGATGAITRFPIPTVLVFLLLTVYFVTQSGFLDDTRFDDDPNNPALNVNGDMEVYLPDGSQVAELLGKVEEDWSTNVMVVYIESDNQNITDQRILQEISYVENILNPYFVASCKLKN